MMDIESIVDILFNPTEATIDFAALTLHNRMKAYPDPVKSVWFALSDQERDFYRLSVKTVLKAVADVYAAALPEIAP